ncbi:MAG: preprotein translocase subunit SecA [Acidobacteriota bacterium]|nr:preprotein translocase subunit SecA [Acidobacteriota bacterium]
MLFGSKNERALKKLLPRAGAVEDWKPAMRQLSDEHLRGKTKEYKRRLEEGESMDDLLPEAFAAVREASRRVLGLWPFTNQVLGGIVLHNGCIAEMATGEGKTLTAAMPLYLNALNGKGAWLVTINDYLAKRDAESMGKIYRFLGMTVGTIINGIKDKERREAYNCDITYGNAYEFGFDYLRDNLKHNAQDLVQRDLIYAVVDEVDAVLIDEARTPVIISRPTDERTDRYHEANAVILKLEQEVHYIVDSEKPEALFTEEGIRRMESILDLPNLYDSTNIAMLHYLKQSLIAHKLFKRDVDYLLRDNRIDIIEAISGRALQGRRYSDGLHEALEAKEGVKIENVSETMASIIFTHFFKMFEKLSGMTGTAKTEAAEFLDIYKLEVVVIPTNRPMIREDADDLVFKTRKAKIDAIVDEIEAQHRKGRPMLVGTVDGETGEELSAYFRKRGIKHVVLNAESHESEAEVMARAGRLGALTIASNMAGLGTDILPGGNPEAPAIAEHRLKPEADYELLLARHKKTCDQEKKKVLEVGGLYVLGTERHESRRLDNRLRCRSGRQGDPGKSCFYLSLEDKSMRFFDSERFKGKSPGHDKDDEPIMGKKVNRAVERAQKPLEQRGFRMRKLLLEYDNVMNEHRLSFYRLRRDLLLRNDPRTYLFRSMESLIDLELKNFEAVKHPEQRHKKQLFSYLEAQFKFKPTEMVREMQPLDSEILRREIRAVTRREYTRKWEVLGLTPDIAAEHERFVMLYTMDQQWKDHILNMELLKDQVVVRPKDAFLEYKVKSKSLFENLMYKMDEEMVKTLIYLQLKHTM